MVNGFIKIGILHYTLHITLGQKKKSFVSGRPCGQKKFDPGSRKTFFLHKWKSK